MNYKPVFGELVTLVGNRTAYAVQKDDGSYFPVQDVSKNDFILALGDHLKCKYTIGTYIVEGDKARTLVFDVDSGEDAREEVVKLRKVLSQEYGIPANCHGVEYSGNKGFHLWIVFGDYVPANHLRRLGQATAALAEVTCEIFPKQDTVLTLGSLVKLPGSIHQKTKKHNNFVTPFPFTVTKAVYEAAVAKLPEEKLFTGSGFEAYPCLAHIQAGVPDGTRNNSMYHFITMMKRHGVSDDNLWLMAESVNTKFDPPLDAMEFRRTVESALKGGGLRCNDLAEDVQCGDLCVCNRVGLKVRPKTLKYGNPGEKVVVEVTGRNGQVLEISHPDLDAGKVKIKEDS